MSKRITDRRDDRGIVISRMISTTDNRERPLYSFNDLPEDARPEFDYMPERHADELDDPRFVKAYGSWHDTSDTEGLAPSELKSHGWDTYMTDTFWSGVVFQHFDRDGECREGVVVGRFYVEDVW